jgi:hypothetical protein
VRYTLHFFARIPNYLLLVHHLIFAKFFMNRPAARDGQGQGHEVRKLFLSNAGSLKSLHGNFVCQLIQPRHDFKRGIDDL